MSTEVLVYNLNRFLNGDFHAYYYIIGLSYWVQSPLTLRKYFLKCFSPIFIFEKVIVKSVYSGNLRFLKKVSAKLRQFGIFWTILPKQVLAKNIAKS